MPKLIAVCRNSVALGCLLLLTCGAAQAAQVVVSNTNNSLAGSLRQAVQDASPGDTIVFQIPPTDPGYNFLIDTYVITLTSGPEMTIAKNLTIDGAGAKIVVQRSTAGGTPKFYFFNVTAGTVQILNLTLQNGSTVDVGAGAIQNNANLTLRNCLLVGNTAYLAGEAGSIHNLAGGTTSLFNCTLSDNSGEVVIWNDFGTLVLRDCTIFANHVTTAALFSFGSAVTRIRNTIAAGTTDVVNQSNARPDASGPFISEGYNLIGDASGASGFGSTGDQLGASVAQVKLGPLEDNGGRSLTRRPLPGSVAIDQGNRGVDQSAQPINTDGRGSPRPVDQPAIANAIGGDASDIGAVETGLSQPGPTFTVTNTSDSNDGSCSTEMCTLRDALNASNANPDANTINFAFGLMGEIVTGSGLTITNPVAMNGPGARVLQIRANGNPTVISTAGDVTLSGLSLSNGGSSVGNGGAISHLGGGKLSLFDCLLARNLSGGTLGGGAIYNDSGNTLLLTRCTFSTNAATNAAGGAIYNLGSLTATNCTFFNNNALNGGAIISKANAGLSNTTLRNCTFVLNTAGDTNTGGGSGGGGIYAEGANTQFHLANTIISQNYSSGTNPDVRGNVTSDGHNFIGKVGFASGLTNGVNGDQVGSGTGISPGFTAAVLENNGGPTDTARLVSPSTAIDAGDDALAPITDQRGYLRSGVSDIGAFEFNGTVPVLKITSITRSVNGHVILQGLGLANSTHTIEAASTPDASSFSVIGKATSNGSGVVPYDDATSVDLTKGFYRLVFP